MPAPALIALADLAIELVIEGVRANKIAKEDAAKIIAKGNLLREETETIHGDWKDAIADDASDDGE
jgi:hypothetical protein